MCLILAFLKFCLILEKLSTVSKKTYVAKTIQGLEQVLADELEQLGVQNIRPGRRMVEFETDIQTMYALN